MTAVASPMRSSAWETREAAMRGARSMVGGSGLPDCARMNLEALETARTRSRDAGLSYSQRANEVVKARRLERRLAVTCNALAELGHTATARAVREALKVRTPPVVPHVSRARQGTTNADRLARLDAAEREIQRERRR